ncbi:hypothetical protein BDZ91DRAFT_731889 [Kalaharituber pfeilii]|nr:hypothetical protein BDZ91DRAFT_731889 [Kalaharituber pfeilii]
MGHAGRTTRHSSSSAHQSLNLLVLTCFVLRFFGYISLTNDWTMIACGARLCFGEECEMVRELEVLSEQGMKETSGVLGTP